VLLDQGKLDINAANADGWRLVNGALISPDMSLLKFVIERGAVLNYDQLNPIIECVKNRLKEPLMILKQAGANPNHSSVSPFYYVFQREKDALQWTQLLLDIGADPNPPSQTNAIQSFVMCVCLG